MLYALGEQHRIVGISGFTVRPPQARKEKPKVSAFTSAKIDQILALRPDLAIGFSDIQADIARELVKAGVEVWISNHRSVDGILAYIRRLGAMVGAHEAAGQLARRAEQHIAAASVCASQPSMSKRSSTSAHWCSSSAWPVQASSAAASAGASVPARLRQCSRLEDVTARTMGRIPGETSF